jgi:FMN-dependent dehydrogenase
VLLSNHGGQATETGRATIDILPEVVDAVGSQMPVFVDGDSAAAPTCIRPRQRAHALWGSAGLTSTDSHPSARRALGEFSTSCVPSLFVPFVKAARRR